MARQILAQRDRTVRCGTSAVSGLSILLAVVVTATHSRGADAELGRYLSSECTTCHRPESHSTIPNIHGLAESTFAQVVKAYRDKRLDNPVMQNVAGRLSDEDIAALAAYFATTKKASNLPRGKR